MQEELYSSWHSFSETASWKWSKTLRNHFLDSAHLFLSHFSVVFVIGEADSSAVASELHSVVYYNCGIIIYTIWTVSSAVTAGPTRIPKRVVCIRATFFQSWNEPLLLFRNWLSWQFDRILYDVNFGYRLQKVYYIFSYLCTYFFKDAVSSLECVAYNGVMFI